MVVCNTFLTTNNNISDGTLAFLSKFRWFNLLSWKIMTSSKMNRFVHRIYFRSFKTCKQWQSLVSVLCYSPVLQLNIRFFLFYFFSRSVDAVFVAHVLVLPTWFGHVDCCIFCCAVQTADMRVCIYLRVCMYCIVDKTDKGQQLCRP